MAYLVSARYGAMHFISNFVSSTDELHLHDKVILRSDRGTEVGEIISAPEYIMRGTDTSHFGELARKMTKKDEEAFRHIEDTLIPLEVKFCEQLIRNTRIPMKLATVEHLFGGEKIIFYFLADGRVDFRQLVKDLAGEYHTRIEMRQIGVRDEARLLAEYEHCGRPLCCKAFIRDLQPVTMRMAKSQKTTLDPAKISGRCGRLMCCLRFEDETYGALKSNLPNKGDLVVIKQGTGRVIGQDVLAQLVLVEMPDGSELKVELSEIMRIEPQKKEQQNQQNSKDQQRGGPRNGSRRNSGDRRDGGQRGPREQRGPRDARPAAPGPEEPEDAEPEELEDQASAEPDESLPPEQPEPPEEGGTQQ